MFVVSVVGLYAAPRAVGPTLSVPVLKRLSGGALGVAVAVLLLPGKLKIFAAAAATDAVAGFVPKGLVPKGLVALGKVVAGLPAAAVAVAGSVPKELVVPKVKLLAVLGDVVAAAAAAAVLVIAGFPAPAVEVKLKPDVGFSDAAGSVDDVTEGNLKLGVGEAFGATASVARAPAPAAPAAPAAPVDGDFSLLVGTLVLLFAPSCAS